MIREELIRSPFHKAFPSAAYSGGDTSVCALQASLCIVTFVLQNGNKVIIHQKGMKH